MQLRLGRHCLSNKPAWHADLHVLVPTIPRLIQAAFIWLASCRRMAEEDPTQLLALPNACLSAVLQCCAGDLRSLFSAARAHSRLRQVAGEVLSSITVGRVTQQRHVDSVLLYLSNHGGHVHCLHLEGVADYGSWSCVSLLRLPPSVQLDSCACSCSLTRTEGGEVW